MRARSIDKTKAIKKRSKSIVLKGSIKKTKDQPRGSPKQNLKNSMKKNILVQQSASPGKNAKQRPLLKSSRSKKNLQRSREKVQKSQDKGLQRSRSRSNIVSADLRKNQSMAKVEHKGKVQPPALPLLKQKKVEEVKVPQEEEREMGMTYMHPEHDKVVLKVLEATDQVYEKYLQMLKSDNDGNYVLNAFPQLRSFKKEEDSSSMSRSALFDSPPIDKVVTATKRLPAYYAGPCGKSLQSLKIILLTKFKVEISIGLLQYSLDGDRLTIFRTYVSKIYRRMNYLAYILLETIKMLLGKHANIDRLSIFILDKNIPVQKFFKYLGFKIDKIATDSYQKNVDYFQEFFLKKKELITALNSFK